LKDGRCIQDDRTIGELRFDLDAIYPSVQSARKTSLAKMVYVSNGKVKEEDYT
jgi:hypothetical protein